MTKPYNTLFLLTSVDGKISTGDNDSLDVDKDFPTIPEPSGGLHQYYNIEQQTDLYSMNSGRVLAKVGINDKTDIPEKTPVSFIVIDNEPHLTEKGVSYLSKKSKELFIVTTNKNHPANSVNADNIKVILYQVHIDFADLMNKLKTNYSIDRITIQTGGTLNEVLLHQGLIDKLLLVVAPVLIGGKDTTGIIDGESLHTTSDLAKLKPLKFIEAKPLEDSYLQLEYEVIN